MPTLQPRLNINQIPHLRPRIIRIEIWPWPLPIPAPLLTQLGVQLALEHLNDILPQHREELPPVEIATCRDVEPLRGGVWGDDEVAASSECIPAVEVSIREMGL